ncbi:cation diffusion facilitator 1 [Blastomyces dermatitidis ATCC 18188]|uniref:Cation diffusion facilitator 1 n=1 Tax=Ajellomyces dermatitidis (strain ATCC 18188 / CBS 674.68) TaxID=653446 RepID=F2T9F8_AJEDA|nr:cation diffusion facilitator 1 [Blastomyces dermatitidis ATCC 18188]
MRSDWLDSTLKRTAASVKWAVNGSFSVNLCLFVIQTFAAILHGLAGPLRSRDRCIHGSSFVRGHHAHHFADGRPCLNLTNIPWDSAGPKRSYLYEILSVPPQSLDPPLPSGSHLLHRPQQ